MEYQFHITLSDDDYIAFNQFHSKYSEHGKKSMRTMRNLCLGLLLLIIVLELRSSGFTFYTAVYAVLMSLFILLFLFAYKKLIGKLLALQVKSMRKVGKLPYDKEVTFQFREDVFIDTAISRRSEQGYELIEHIYFYKEHYLFIYNSSLSAYILPISQLKEQLDLEAFTAFLAEKSGKIEYIK